MDRSRRNTSVSGEADTRPETEPQIQPVQKQEPETTTTPKTASLESPRSAHSHPSRVPLDPPITKHTLSELDVTKIIHNSKLRHDINFDPDLHFRPNVEGDKGRRKQERSDSFWRTLKDQLSQFVLNRDEFYRQCGNDHLWCLPVLLKTIKEILETLVPQRDREVLDEGLNVDLLMQQFHRGVLDLEKLAEWLSGVLKSHCAPMRDEEVDSMLNLVKTGNRENDLGTLVLGMRELLSVLEHMKLDVANHQIRCLRPILIQDTTHFEQRYFYKKLNNSGMGIGGSTLWYQNAKQRSSGNAPRSFGEMSVLFEGLSRLILPSAAGTRMPETLQLDHERLLKLRADMLDAINLDICMRLYHDLERVARLTASAQFGCAQDDEGSKTSSRTLSTDFNLSTPATGSRPSSLVFSSAGSNSSSPRSSLVIPAYVAPDHNEAKNKAQDLYNSLVALLYTAPHATDQNTRWRAIAPSMAIQIFRYTDAPSDMLAVFEERLKSSLCQFESELYQEAEHHLHQRLMEELGNKVHEYKGLSAVSLYTAASEKRMSSGSKPRDFYECLRDGQEDAALDDMATRLAHVGILHWRVWAGLAYLAE
ncbi:Protein SOSEKI 1 [Amphichorda felina]